MAAFLVRANIEDVRKAVRKQLKSQGFGLREGPRLPSSRILFARKRSEHLWQNIEATVRLVSHENATLVDTKFQMALFSRIVLLIPVVYLTTIILFFVLHTDEFTLAFCYFTNYIVAFLTVLFLGISSTLPEFPTCCVVLVVMIGAIFLALKAVLRPNAGKALSEASTELLESLRKTFSVRLLVFAKLRSFPVSFLSCYVIVSVIVMGILLFKIHLLLLLCGLPFLLWSSLAYLIPLLYEHRPALYPKALVTRAVATITFSKSIVLFLLIMCFAVMVAYNARQEFENSGGRMPFSSFIQYVNSGNALLDEVKSGPERMQQVHTDAKYWADKVIKAAPRAREYESYIEGVFVAPIALVITAGLCYLFFMIILFGKKAVKFPLAWRHYTGKEQIEWIRLPPEIASDGISDVFFRFSMISFFVTGVVLNVLILLAAIDVIWFALANHILLFPWIQTLTTWIFVPFLAIGMLTGTEDAWIWDGLARSVMVILASPSLLIMGRRIIKVCSDFTSRSISSVLNLFLFRQVPEKLTIHINKLCQLYNIECPKVIRIRSKAVHLAILPSLVGNRPMLLLSGGAISQLTETELIAAVAHELAHIKQGMGNIRLLRILSILGGYPPWFLLLLVDFRKLEEDADRFALSAGAEPQALARAIIKASSSGGQSSWLRASIMMWLRKHLPNQVLASFVQPLKLILVTDRFLTSDDLVGYSHPLPRDRIAAIFSEAETRFCDL